MQIFNGAFCFVILCPCLIDFESTVFTFKMAVFTSFTHYLFYLK